MKFQSWAAQERLSGAVARDKMSQDVQINWNLLDSFILIQFLKKKCLVFKDWNTGKRVANFLANMPFLYCKISTFSNQFTKWLITFDGKVPLAWSLHHWISYLTLFKGIPIIVMSDLKMAMAIMAIMAIMAPYGHYGYGHYSILTWQWLVSP